MSKDRSEQLKAAFEYLENLFGDHPFVLVVAGDKVGDNQALSSVGNMGRADAVMCFTAVAMDWNKEAYGMIEKEGQTIQ